MDEFEIRFQLAALATVTNAWRRFLSGAGEAGPYAYLALAQVRQVANMGGDVEASLNDGKPEFAAA